MEHGEDHPENDGTLRARVARELDELVSAVQEVDVATVYRTIVGVIGSHAVPHIAEVIGAGLRQGTLLLEPRLVASDAPPIPFLRRARGGAKPLSNEGAGGGASESSGTSREVVFEKLRPPDGSTPAESAAGAADPAGAPLVLVVEDQPDVNRFLCSALGDTYRVAGALDGAAGLEKALALRPDLLITDVTMPRMNGEELLRAVRAHPDLERTPVVVLTGGADRERRVEMLRAGADDFLTKPLAAEELLACVESVLARARVVENGRRLAGQLERVAQSHAEVSQAMCAPTSSLDDAVLQTIAQQAQALTDAEFVALGIGTDPERPFHPWVTVGVDRARMAALADPPRAVGTLGVVAREARPIRVRALASHPAYRGLPAGHPPIQSFLGVPITLRDQRVGNLYMANKRTGPEFTTEDQHLVETLAARVGPAIQMTRLYRVVGRERAWLSSVIDRLPEPVMVADHQTRSVTLNHAARRLEGSATGEVDAFGNPIALDLRSPAGERLPWDQTPLARAWLHGESITGQELAIRDRAGRLLPVLASAAPVAHGGEGAGGAVAVLQDITALKQLQRLREGWMGIIAHDLRQPLSVIGVIAEELAEILKDAAPGDGPAALGQLRMAVNSLDRMLYDLLDASQLEAGHVKIERQRTSIVPLVREIVDRVSRSSPGLTVTFACDDESLQVELDRGRVEQVLTNLLTNAVKYGDAGAPVRVVVERQPGVASVGVHNHGPAIPAEELPHLFERFYRTAGSAGQRGHGLGLFIVKGLVEAHGGRVAVESSPEAGTWFRVAFPLTVPARSAGT